MQTFTSNKLSKFRKESLNGIEYIVSPVRMIREGVLNGSRGALYYPMKEISESTDSWNHMPIVVNHPKKGSRFVSARDPQILNQYGVGFVFNAKESGDSLDAEAWIDINKLRTVDSSLAEAVERGEAIEVSTGLQTDNFNDKGVFNGKNYDYTARNYKPDHLALLPGEEGACSINDGCGLNVNKNFTIDFIANCKGKSYCSCGCSKKGSATMLDFQTTQTNNIDFVTNEDGVWRTTDEGAKVYIKGGKVYAGGPNGKVVAGGDSKGKGKTKSAAKTAYQKRDNELMKLYRKDRAMGGDASFKEWKAAYEAQNPRKSNPESSSKAQPKESTSSVSATDKKLSSTIKNTKLSKLNSEDSAVLSKIVSSDKDDGIELLDYVGTHIGGFSEKQWDSFVDGRYRDVIGKRDPVSKLKLLKAVSNLPQSKLPDPERAARKKRAQERKRKTKLSGPGGVYASMVKQL